MDLADIQRRVEEAIPGSEVSVDTDGYYVNVSVVSEQFDGLNAVKRQQLVYSGLNELISNGSLHAVTIKANTPEEAQS